jgi:ABC-type Fe3+ transport system permease subunit
VDEGAFERRRKVILRKMWLTAAVMAVATSATGLGVGLVEGSAGWGFAGAMLFCAFAFVASFVGIGVVGGRKGLGQVERLYGKAARRTTLGRLVTKRPDSR